MTQFLVFGDSITYGAWDKEGGWVQRLRTFIEEKYPEEHSIYNLGVSGNTTEDLLQRLDSETKQRLKEDEEETIIVFAIGINDSQYIHDKNNLRTSPEKLIENIQNLIKLAKKFTSKVIFIEITPVDESKTTPIPWNTNKSYRNVNIQKFNEIIKSVCKENNIYFIEVYKQWIKSNYKDLLEDGLHPNSDGHKKIFEIVKNYLVKEKII